jgi:tRNA-Thr(GGU) m(6)t(6)A37 methyltransferase TsaA
MADMEELTVSLKVIGLVRTTRDKLETTPIQAGINRGEQGTIEIAEPYWEGLDGIDGFDYAWLLTWLHKIDRPASGPALSQVPYLLRSSQRRMGMLATRSPRRINPIGLSLIRVVEITGQAVRFTGVDVVDGTPVIDLKPYVTRFDRPDGEPRCGWFDEVPIPEGVTPARLYPGGGA